MSEQPGTDDPADTAPEAGAVVVTRHRGHHFPTRGRRITVRLEYTELAAIELAAGRAGLTPTGYVGAVALAAARGTVPSAPSATQQALAEPMAAWTQLRRFGTNVNQAVTRCTPPGRRRIGWPRRRGDRPGGAPGGRGGRGADATAGVSRP
jgi:hypothetical protein